MRRRRVSAVVTVVSALIFLSACSDWRGANSLPLPGTEGGGDGSYEVQIQMPDVSTLEENSQVKVNDVNVGTVTGVERQGWHALVTVRLGEEVSLPANATAKLGQTSLLGTVHVELAEPLGEPAQGHLDAGGVIQLDRAGEYPSTEQTLSSVSVVLNGSGLAQLQQINQQLNAALSGHESDARGLITQLDTFTSSMDEQKQDIIAASEGLDRLAGQLNARADVLDNALNSIPPALDVLAKDRDTLRDAILAIGNFATRADEVIAASSTSVTENLASIGPVLQQLADAGPNLTKSLGLLATFPWPQAGIKQFIRGDAANLSATIDLTLGRLDNSLLQMTPADGKLTQLETMLGRTAGRQPTPQTKNPLTAPILRGTS
ncbi:MCE family protein [Williamsia sp. DF01-3]|uniref:MCE family protein n=1 Tax=Williamsia sp. DF01-3 TaxID=2934157 RepID=UPI001FF66AC0|nr:MCE family protein [Williamsia sp. DF01-3]MCK0517365.1 MCE family protein [Williamsia sp. DF01-3]